MGPEETNRCVFCSLESLSKPRTKAKAVHYAADKMGLCCSKCYRFSCNACLRVITKKAADIGLADVWCQTVEKHLSGQLISAPFCGHCCEWQNQTKASLPVVNMKYDGYIFFPEFALMIDPNFAGVDIHALGRDSMHNLAPVWHAVIDQAVASQCHNMDVTPDGSAARIIDLYSKVVDVGGSPTKAS